MAIFLGSCAEGRKIFTRCCGPLRATAGLMREDLIMEELPGVQEALSRLPQSVTDERYFRIKRVRAAPAPRGCCAPPANSASPSPPFDHGATAIGSVGGSRDCVRLSRRPCRPALGTVSCQSLTGPRTRRYAGVLQSAREQPLSQRAGQPSVGRRCLAHVQTTVAWVGTPRR